MNTSGFPLLKHPIHVFYKVVQLTTIVHFFPFPQKTYRTTFLMILQDVHMHCETVLI